MKGMYDLLDSVLNTILKREAKLWAEDVKFCERPYEKFDVKYRRALGQMDDGQFAFYAAGFIISNYMLYRKIMELRPLAVEEFGHPYRCWWT